MQKTIETQADIEEALQHLAKADPRLVPLIEAAGPLPLRRRTGGPEGLYSILVAQQLSVASAAAIWKRVAADFAPFDSKTILAANEADFRQCGLSAPKIRTMYSIASAIDCGNLDLERLGEWPADEAHGHLCKVKGIGPWTADIYLMFCLGHADAFASGDLALQEALKIGYGLELRPNAKQLLDFAELWRPWRSVAARLLWAYYHVAKSREGVLSTSD